MDYVFIGGCQRSGTTLLGSILGSHPDVICTPESIFKFSYLEQESLSENDILNLCADWTYKIWGVDNFDAGSGRIGIKELMLKLVQHYAGVHGKAGAKLWVDHTPGNLFYTSAMNVRFSDAKYIHIVRDGRAVSASIKKLDWGLHTISAISNMWKDRVFHALSAERMLGEERILQVRYEDLTTSPEAVMGKICSFIGLEFIPSMIAGNGFVVPRFTKSQHQLVGCRPDSSRNDKWKQELSSREVEIFEYHCGLLLRNLGYPPLFGLTPKGPTFLYRNFMRVADIYYRKRDRLRKNKRIQMGQS